MNAYPHGPVVGPDGTYHVCWVWRDHGGAQTNHDLCYARSPDLREWETSQGEPLEVPIDINSGDLVDPVPPYGGMINNNTKIGFDSEDRVIISYHKFDHEGNTQLYTPAPRPTAGRSTKRPTGTTGGPSAAVARFRSTSSSIRSNTRTADSPRPTNTSSTAPASGSSRRRR